MTNWRSKNDDGPKKKGRFIAVENEKVIRNLAITEFSFKDLCSNHLAYGDNTNANIIRSDLHDKQILAQSVHAHKTLDVEIQASPNRAPVLRPIDFTLDWERQKARATARRALKLDDEEDLDLELELRTPDSHPAEDQKKHHAREPEVQKSEATAESVMPANETVESSLLQQFREQATTMDKIGKEITRVSPPDVPTASPLQVDVEKASLPDAPGHIPANVTGKAEFIPFKPAQDDVVALEEQSADEYKMRVQAQAEIEEMKQKIFDEAKAEGYKSGFREGETKASLQMQHNANDVIQNLGNLVHELEGLKKNILQDVQKNFYEICQALAESLFRREFRVNPETFASIIQKAISETINDDNVKIAVSAQDFARLNQLDNKDLLAKLTKDDSLKPGDFRVSSAQGVVDGNLSKLISDLLDQADTTLFDETKKAG